MGFFDQIWGGIQSAGRTISSVAGTVYGDVKGFISGAGNGAVSIVTGAQGVVNNLVNKTATLGNNIVDTAGKVVPTVATQLGGTLSSLGQSLSLPLLIAGGAVAIFLVTRK